MKCQLVFKIICMLEAVFMSGDIISNVCKTVIQSFNSLFFMRVFHAAIFVSPFISMAETVINAQVNFWPLAVSI